MRPSVKIDLAEGVEMTTPELNATLEVWGNGDWYVSIDTDAWLAERGEPDAQLTDWLHAYHDYVHHETALAAYGAEQAPFPVATIVREGKPIPYRDPDNAPPSRYGNYKRTVVEPPPYLNGEVAWADIIEVWLERNCTQWGLYGEAQTPYDASIATFDFDNSLDIDLVIYLAQLYDGTNIAVVQQASNYYAGPPTVYIDTTTDSAEWYDTDSHHLYCTSPDCDWLAAFCGGQYEIYQTMITTLTERELRENLKVVEHANGDVVLACPSCGSPLDAAS